MDNNTCVTDNQQLITCKHEDRAVKTDQSGMDPRMLSVSKDVICIIKSLVELIP